MRGIVAAIAGLVVAASSLTGQARPAPVAPAAVAATAVVDTARPPISPGRAFLQSALIPGLAQSRLDRSAGVLFAAVEMLAITMYAKSSFDLRTARRFSRDSTPATYEIDAETGLARRDPKTNDLVVATWRGPRYTESRAQARAAHLEDWRALLIFNHLFAAADAFVAAQLWDLPGRVDLRVSPTVSRVGIVIPW
jgi:hypothetical protein